VNGVSNEAMEAITKGKQAIFFIINGHDLMMLLDDKMDLKEFLRRRQRLLGEEGSVYVPFNRIVGI
jgi:hypothetical protein